MRILSLALLLVLCGCSKEQPLPTGLHEGDTVRVVFDAAGQLTNHGTLEKSGDGWLVLRTERGVLWIPKDKIFAISKVGGEN
jgi:hypothetical protein